MKKQWYDRLAKPAALTVIALALAACGGGGGGGDSPEANANPQQVAPDVDIVVPSLPIVVPPASEPVASAPDPVEEIAKSLPVPDKTAQKLNQRIGANVSAVTYYARSHEYVDLMQQAGGFGLPDGPWIDPATKGRGPIALDAQGWPTEDFAIMMMSGQRNTPGLAGRYTIVFKGTASVSLIASSGTLSAPTLDSATGMTVVHLDFPVAGDQIVLNFKNTSGGVKDLRVIRPGYQWNSPTLPVFTTTYLKHLEAFSTLRFMDWLASNATYDGTWANRPTIQSTRGGLGPKGSVPGKPWERVIELANASASDIWINVPAKADATYYTELAKLLKAKLDPRLKIYVEYSNEMWNFNFPQYHWLTTTAVADEMAAGNTRLNADGATQPYVLGYRVFTERTFRISDAFRAVFGDSAMMDRVRPVLAWQAAGSYHMENMLKYAQTAFPGRPVSSYIYAISGAPYFNLGTQQSTAGLTTQQVLTAMDESLGKSPLSYRYEHNAYLAKKYGVRWVAYEGGPDTFGTGSLDSKAAANRDASMYTMCQRFLNDWNSAGGGLFLWFHAGAGSWSTQYGTWPLEEYLGNDVPSAKMSCMIWASTLAPAVATTRHVPGVAFDAAEVAGQFLTVGTTNYNIEKRWYQVGQSREYVISSPTATCYKLSLTGVFAGDRGLFDVAINGATAISGAPVVPSAADPVKSDLGNICLDAGVNVMNLKMTQVANGVMDKILFAPQ